MHRSRMLTLLAFLCLALPSLVAAQFQPDPAQLQALEGEYTPAGRTEAALSFFTQEGQLFYESQRIPPIALKALSAIRFEDPQDGPVFLFQLDGSGRALSVSIVDNAKTSASRTGPPVHHLFHEYRRTEAMIPMRDGVRLHTVILAPAGIPETLPFLIQRTPYGASVASREWFFLNRPNLAREGYLYVGQDVRGRNGSEGEFLMSRPAADPADPKATDETTDAYDTVEWLLNNVSGNNGRAGLLGTSYPGFLAMAAGLAPHPAVKAISPQAPMIDVWMGDDFFHNGAFRQGYGYDYVLGMESGGQKPDYGSQNSGKKIDAFGFFLRNANFANSAKASGLPLLPTWKLFLEHQDYDQIWQARAVQLRMKAVTVPTLTVAGYYDPEDLFGPQEEYARLEAFDQEGKNFLVLGPWRHGQWALPARSTGQIQWGSATGDHFRELENAFFAYYLKDKPGFDLVDTLSFQSGSNQWRRYAHFPPAEAKATPLYLAAHGQLGWDRPLQNSATTYKSNPAKPVPYRHLPIQPTYGDGSQWGNWLTEDQRFVTRRKDVATWKLPVQTRPLTLTGEVTADLFVSTTGTDADLVVKLIDQFPKDDPDPAMRRYQLIVNAEIFRARYLDAFDHPHALTPGTVHEFRFSLHAADHVFLPGHTLVVQVQSSWFPLYDRNPQRFVPSIMTAQPKDFMASRITIHSGAGHDSSVLLPVVAEPVGSRK